MRKVLFFLLVLILSVWLGLVIESDPGYALFVYKTWTMEMPLWFVVIAWCLSVMVVDIILLGGKSLFALKSVLGVWRQRKQATLARKRTNEGLLALAEGHWASAEKCLIRGATIDKFPLVNYLAAAFAAQQQNNSRQQDDYLRKAHEAMPQSGLVIGLTQAQLQMAEKQYEQALATLRHLETLAPGHHRVLDLLQQVYVCLEDWQSVRELLPALSRYKVLSKQNLQTLERRAYHAYFAQQQQSMGQPQIQETWRKVPKHLRYDVELLSSYVRCLINADLHTQAASALQDALDRQWQDCWIKLYAQVKLDNSNKQIQIVEKWLTKHAQNADLLLCIGQLYLRSQLWGKAKQYLEASLGIKPQLAVYQGLVQVAEQLDEQEVAYRYYREGLQHALAAEVN